MPSPLELAIRARTRAETRFDDGARAIWSTDASNYRHIPLGVAFPRSEADLVEIIAICREHDVSITTRGAGTSLAGQGCNTGLIVDCSRHLNQILEINPAARTARVQPGVILDALRDAVAPFGLTFGPDPATHNRCTIGGMIGNNACGAHSVMAQFYGPGPLTRHQVLSLDVVTYDGQRFTVGATTDDELAAIIAEGGARGEIYRKLRDLRDANVAEIRTRFVDIPRRVSGYNLDALLPECGFNVAHALTGTEGTCVTILSATLQLIDALPFRSLVVLGYADAFCAADHVPTVMAHRPVALEGMDGTLVSLMRQRQWHPQQLAMLPPGNGWLLVEFGGATQAAADAAANACCAALARDPGAPSITRCRDAHDARHFWSIREAALGVAAHPPGMAPAHEGWEDAAVAPERLGAYLREFAKLLREFEYSSAMYGHFGQGCVHFRIDFDFTTVAGIEKWSNFLEAASDLVVRHGGSISGEHGDGQARAVFLRKMYGDQLVTAFEQFKAIFDPLNRMNPGKVVHPRRPDQDLRVSLAYQPAETHTHFTYGEDEGSFANAMTRCVGVGACRREDSGTMCPSYMVTRDEEHSTRGRARILFEMMQGEVISDGWQSEAVKQSLDLCLSCKACKSECPVSVDMATYKAEFLSHYYEHHARPLLAHASGHIDRWLHHAAPLAPLANFFASTPPFSTIAKRLLGVASERSLPRIASPTLRRWFAKRATRSAESAKRVIFWPDTFSNYLRPDGARSAILFLERSGYEVTLPKKPLCCGRPLYDWGMLDQAKQQWREILDALRADIRAGVPLVGVEPGCLSTFRDELINLFPGDADAKRLSEQTFLFSEFVLREGIELPVLSTRAIVHGHCHQRSVFGMQSDLQLLDKLGVEHTLLDSGCCGMAGAFGFERDKYPVSVAAAERVLMPAVRACGDDTVILTNGFSCQEQIAQLSGRKAVGIAEVMRQEQPSSRAERGTGE